jgi:DNA-binding MarR family transcriptional regulator
MFGSLEPALQVLHSAKRKLVKPSAHPSDTRAKVLTLAPIGETTLQQALPLIERLDAEFFGSCNYLALLTDTKRK